MASTPRDRTLGKIGRTALDRRQALQAAAIKTRQALQDDKFQHSEVAITPESVAAELQAVVGGLKYDKTVRSVAGRALILMSTGA